VRGLSWSMLPFFFVPLLDPCHMNIKTPVCFFDQLAVKPFFADTCLVSSHQNNCLPIEAEGEGHAPNATCGFKP
jgi:hypothetical protein